MPDSICDASKVRATVFNGRCIGDTIAIPDGFFRCPECGHLLFRGVLGAGSMIEMKCLSCKGLPKVKKI
jgi:hypothetical protein